MLGYRHATVRVSLSPSCTFDLKSVCLALQVKQAVLGYGSQGTVVFEGYLHGRPVAVKRMMGHLYDIAKLEIDALIASDEVQLAVICSVAQLDTTACCGMV